MNALLDFAMPQLARTVAALPSEQIDDLPFGVVGLDPNGAVRVFNRTEARLSGYKSRPALGRTFFVEVAPCMNNGYFKGRIDKALRAGTLDMEFSFIGDFSDPDRELNVRVQPAEDGGLWIFLDRPHANGGTE